MKREDLEAREFALIIASSNFPFYAAPEADAVMDAMEARIKELEAENERLMKIVRHQKHKRCLTMAEWCDAEADVADADGDYDDMRWYQKWHTRWLEYAEIFNPNKELKCLSENHVPIADLG